jgi:hypothetical protein
VNLICGSIHDYITFNWNFMINNFKITSKVSSSNFKNYEKFHIKQGFHKIRINKGPRPVSESQAKNGVSGYTFKLHSYEACFAMRYNIDFLSTFFSFGLDLSSRRYTLILSASTKNQHYHYNFQSSKSNYNDDSNISTPFNAQRITIFK